MIKLKSSGSDFSNTARFLQKAKKYNKKFSVAELNDIANMTLNKLKEATPKDTGLTAKSWKYEIIEDHNSNQIVFSNTNVVKSSSPGENQNGVNVVLLLEFGHVTPQGSWIEGKGFVEPIIREMYFNIVNDTWKELSKS